MFTRLLYACSTAVLLVLAFGSQAQNYRPFRPGLLYQLSAAAGDSTFSIRLEKPGGYVLGDSAYGFNNRLVQNAAGGSSVCSSDYRHFNGGSGPFGAVLAIRPTGRATPEYRFSIGTSTLVLQPGAPLNQAWNALGSLTAQVTSRAVEPVLGQADSVVTISFSDGRALKLSKTWGFVAGPVVQDYLLGRRTVRQWALTALPTKQLGQVRLGARAMYNFQPGDVLWYSVSERSGSVPTPTPAPTRTYYGDSVLTRTVSRSGDTITYRIARGTTSPQPWSIYTLVVHERMLPRLLEPSNYYEPNTNSSGNDGVWLTDMAPFLGQYNNRPVQRLVGRYYHCVQPATNRMWVRASMPDLEQYDYYSPGLGQVNATVINTTCCYTFRTLVGYRKRGIPTPGNPTPPTEQWGTLYRFGGILLGAADHRPAASTSAFPNPITNELTVRFEAQRTQTASLSLYNTLGQLVQQRQQAVAAGTAQVLLPLPALPVGLYTLHLRHDDRTEVLKLTAAGR